MTLQREIDDQTGETLVDYIQVRKGVVSQTKELEDGYAYADYDRNGHLLGIEFIGAPYAPTCRCRRRLTRKVGTKYDVYT